MRIKSKHSSNRLVLMLAAFGAAACAERVMQRSTNVRPKFATIVDGTDTLALTYVCGNTFRVTSSLESEHTFKWRLANGSDSGQVFVPKRLPRNSVAEAFFSTSAADSVLLYRDANSLMATVNANTPGCTVAHDTTWLRTNEVRNMMTLRDFSSKLATSGGQWDSVYARNAEVAFAGTKSRSQIATFLATRHARVVYEWHETALIHFDTVFSTYAQLRASLDSLSDTTYFSYVRDLGVGEYVRRKPAGVLRPDKSE